MTDEPRTSLPDDPPADLPGSPPTAPVEAAPRSDPGSIDVPAATASEPASIDVGTATASEPAPFDVPAPEPRDDTWSETRPIAAPHRSAPRAAFGIGAALIIAAGLGFGAATLVVPRLADVSPPPLGAISTATPTPSPSAVPTPTTTPSPTASSSPSPTPRQSTTTYVVQRGDILSSIAQRFGVSVAAIVAANDLKDPNHIETGQTLIIPAPTASAAPTPSPVPASPTPSG